MAKGVERAVGGYSGETVRTYGLWSARKHEARSTKHAGTAAFRGPGHFYDVISHNHNRRADKQVAGTGAGAETMAGSVAEERRHKLQTRVGDKL